MLKDAAADAWGTLVAFQRLQPLRAAAASAGTVKAAPLPTLRPTPALDPAPAPTPAPTAFSVSAIEIVEKSPCRFFGSSKGCRFGAACRFKHEN